jgi:predicted RNA-binding Zn-ribbon protein involved in translation (DUF1610 family)
MKKVKRRKVKIAKCPDCSEVYTEYPALSRKDNKTEICSACGVREALQDNLYLNRKMSAIFEKIHQEK